MRIDVLRLEKRLHFVISSTGEGERGLQGSLDRGDEVPFDARSTHRNAFRENDNPDAVRSGSIHRCRRWRIPLRHTQRLRVLRSYDRQVGAVIGSWRTAALDDHRRGEQPSSESRLNNSVFFRWCHFESTIHRRSRSGVLTCDRLVYAIGGFDGIKDLAAVEVFSPYNGHWTSLPPMSCRRSCLGSAALNGLIYVGGGFDGYSCLSTVERYDPLVGVWTTVQSMEHRRRYGRFEAHGKLPSFLFDNSENL